MSNNEDWFYQVGYRKPPRRSQFQRGRSGNPKGRPKRSIDSETLFRKTLLETVVANENGRQRKITKVEAILTQLVNKAALGDHRSTALLLGRIASLRLFKSEKPPSGLSNEAVDLIRDRLCGTVRKTAAAIVKATRSGYTITAAHDSTGQTNRKLTRCLG